MFPSKTASESLTLTTCPCAAPKKPIRKLPASIDLPDDAEIDDVKVAIARQVGVKDHNRIGLFNPTSRKRIADRKALVRDQGEVIANGEILVQDLGTQFVSKHCKSCWYLQFD